MNSIIYEGPSMLDGEPIVVITIDQSSNDKTGNMLQTYILRADMEPLEANKTGNDVSICGNCPHKGIPTNDPKRKQAEKRSCYVFLGQGPTQVYRKYKRGGYNKAYHLSEVEHIGAGKAIRLGTYGDPAAVPKYVWTALMLRARKNTGYSHQWRTSKEFDPTCTMVSADSLRDAIDAWKKGYRTFRIVKDVSEIVKEMEVLCPASKEAGKKTTCAKCGLCGGTNVKAKSVAIPGHGTGAKYIQSA